MKSGLSKEKRCFQVAIENLPGTTFKAVSF